jgi:DNA-binding response OmpR family regulator
MSSLLIVHQDTTIRQRIASAMATLNTELVSCGSVLYMLQHLWPTLPRLLILSDNLPGVNVLEICRQIRRNRQLDGMSIMLLKSEMECTGVEVARAMEAGVDDYISTNRHDAELAARAGALVRRAQLHSPDPPTRPSNGVRAPLWTVPDSPYVLVGERTIQLTEIEQKLMRCLAEAESVASFSELLGSVWDTLPDSEHGKVLLRAHIRNLRKKVEANPSRPEYIQSKYGVGYYLANYAGVKTNAS